MDVVFLVVHLEEVLVQETVHQEDFDLTLEEDLHFHHSGLVGHHLEEEDPHLHMDHMIHHGVQSHPKEDRKECYPHLLLW